MRSGSLGDAIRASMSFPMVFEPIEIDSVLMYDGGIYDNFPVDVMRSDFAPDIMIGVDVSAPDTKPDRNNMFQQLGGHDNPEQRLLPAGRGGDKDTRACTGSSDCSTSPCQREIYQIGYDKAMSMMDSITSRVTARIPSEARSAAPRGVQVGHTLCALRLCKCVGRFARSERVYTLHFHRQ